LNYTRVITGDSSKNEGIMLLKKRGQPTKDASREDHRQR